jgi:anti-sigma B factor antagonist
MAIQEGLTGPADFTADVREQHGAIVVELCGELDLSTAGELRETLASPAVLGAPTIRVDLAQVTFMDSCIIGLLVTACKRVRAQGATFSVSCGQSRTRRTIEIAGLLDYFEITDAALK